MKTIRLLMLPAILFALYSTSCLGADNATSQAASAQSGYDLGFAKGQEDGRGGLSRTPGRYESLYSQADRAEFFRGYEAGYNQGIKVPASKSYGQPLTAVKGKGKVTIKEGSRTVAVCSTASPNVEEARFITEQQEIVVKSRGNHGPATVQLFDTKSGKEKSRVMAYKIRDGKPAWAAGMEE
jgi:hypothetical protein